MSANVGPSVCIVSGSMPLHRGTLQNAGHCATPPLKRREASGKYVDSQEESQHPLCGKERRGRRAAAAPPQRISPYLQTVRQSRAASAVRARCDAAARQAAWRGAERRVHEPGAGKHEVEHDTPRDAVATRGLFAAPDILDPGVVSSRASTTHSESLRPAACERGSAASAPVLPAKDVPVRPPASHLHATAHAMTAPCSFSTC